MGQRHVLILFFALLSATLAFFGSTVMLPAPVVSAHAFVIGSDPVDGSTISKAPSVVHIYFNANISSISTAEVYAFKDGQTIDVTAGQSTVSPSNPHQLVTPLKPAEALPEGSYEIQWSAVANDDGHTTYGLIGFNVGFSGTGLSGTPVLGPSTSNNLTDMRAFSLTNSITVLWDWLVLLALTLWLGLLVTERLTLATLDQTSPLLERARQQTLPLQRLCLVGLLLGELIALVLRAIHIAQALDVPFDGLQIWHLISQTYYGTLWLARIALILAAMALLAWNHQLARRSKNTTVSPQQYTVVWLILAGLLVLTYALTDDTTQNLPMHIGSIVFTWCHWIALSTWFGGLVYLGYILYPLITVIDREQRAGTVVALQHRFTPFQYASIGVLLVSSLFLAGTNIHSAQQWVQEPYGLVLLVQFILLGTMLLVSLYWRLALGPKLKRQALLLSVVDPELPARRARLLAFVRTGRSLKRIVSLQAWLVVAALLCSALLAFYAPPIVYPAMPTSNPPAQSVHSPAAQTQQVGEFALTLQILPAQFNQTNVATLLIKDRQGNPVTNAQVQLTINMTMMDMGTTHITMSGEKTLYSAKLDKSVISMAGLWNIEASIQLPGQTAFKTRFKIMFQ